MKQACFVPFYQGLTLAQHAFLRLLMSSKQLNSVHLASFLEAELPFFLLRSIVRVIPDPCFSLLWLGVGESMQPARATQVTESHDAQIVTVKPGRSQQWPCVRNRLLTTT